MTVTKKDFVPSNAFFVKFDEKFSTHPGRDGVFIKYSIYILGKN